MTLLFQKVKFYRKCLLYYEFLSPILPATAITTQYIFNIHKNAPVAPKKDSHVVSVQNKYFVQYTQNHAQKFLITHNVPYTWFYT